MNRIEHLIAHPHDVQKSDIPLLKKEIEKHPYFYSLRALLLYGLKRENHPSFDDQLHQTSIYSNNRVDLYHYLNSNPLSEDERTQRIHAASALFTNEKSMALPEIETANPHRETKASLPDNASIDEEETLDTENDTIDAHLKERTLTNEEYYTPCNLEIDTEINVLEAIRPSIEESVLEEKNNADPLRKLETQVESYNETTDPIAVISNEEIVDEPLAENDTIQPVLTEIPHRISQDIQEHIKDNPIITTESTVVAKDGITFSFNDWLKHAMPLNDEQVIETTEKEIKYQLIDDFLERNPKISPLKKNDPSPNTVSVNFQQNSEEYSDLMTETLAQIYIEQKKYDKAIKAYKILSLKYPEKNSLFANRIKEIEKFKNTKS